MDVSRSEYLNGWRTSSETWSPEEDSFARKAASCIPIVGVIFSLMNEYSLNTELETQRDTQKIVKLIEVKNHYKKAAIIREFIAIALIAICMATGYLRGTPSLTLGGVGITVLLGVIGLHGYRIHYNKVVKDKIEKGETGLFQTK